MGISLSDIGQQIAKWAPVVGDAVTGNIPGAVVAVANALKTDPTPESIQKAIQNDPEAAIKLKQLDVQMAQVEANLKKAGIEAGTARVQAVSQVAISEQKFGDIYVKHTRPEIARKSFDAGTAYTLISYLVHVASVYLNAHLMPSMPVLPGPDVYVMGVLYSPCFAYMGMRTADAFSKSGKTE